MCLYRETSDLVFCVADLQLNNQKLQDEVRKLKQAVESMEDTNQKLIEENEELKAQAKLYRLILRSVSPVFFMYKTYLNTLLLSLPTLILQRAAVITEGEDA